MLKLTLVTPNKKLYSKVEVEEVVIPAFRGQLNILSKHAPLVTTLSAGVLKVKLKGTSTFKKAAISWGYCEIVDDDIIILAETAEWPEEIDVRRAEQQFAVAEKRMQDAGLMPVDYSLALQKKSKETARLQASKPE